MRHIIQPDAIRTDHIGRTVDGVEVLDQRVGVVPIDRIHAGPREAGDDDARVGEQVDALGRVDALRDAPVEAAGGVVAVGGESAAVVVMAEALVCGCGDGSDDDDAGADG